MAAVLIYLLSLLSGDPSQVQPQTGSNGPPPTQPSVPDV